MARNPPSVSAPFPGVAAAVVVVVIASAVLPWLWESGVDAAAVASADVAATAAERSHAAAPLELSEPVGSELELDARVAVPTPPPEPLEVALPVAAPEVRASEALDAALALLEQARALALDPARRDETLAAYAIAENALRLRMDFAYSRRDELAIQAVEPTYQACIEESDRLATEVYDAARIARTPWRDLLDPSGAKRFANDGLGGFVIDVGGLRATGAGAGSGREGIFSIGDLEHWRDFVLEVEYAPVRGTARMYWRCGAIVQAAPDEVQVEAADDTSLAPEAPRTITATYVGSLRRFEWSANTERDPEELPIAWRKSRSGAFCVVVGEDAELRITRLRVRVLRAGR